MVRFQVAEMTKGRLTRGLYVLPAMAPDGGFYAFAVTSANAITASGIVHLRWGGNLDVAAEALAVELDAADPMTDQLRRRLLRVG